MKNVLGVASKKSGQWSFLIEFVKKNANIASADAWSIAGTMNNRLEESPDCMGQRIG